MAQLHAEAQRTIARPIDLVYTIISDYGGRRRQIMPAAYHDVTVETSDGGAATVVRWVLHVGSHRRPYAMQITQAPADHRLVERDSGSTFSTEWLVESLDGGSRVTIASNWQQRSSGFPALFERLFAPRSLARLHAETLRLLEQEAAGSPT